MSCTHDKSAEIGVEFDGRRTEWCASCGAIRFQFSVDDYGFTWGPWSPPSNIDEALRQLAAEQATHARFVQRISRALGDYTGSFEDACIARLEAFAAVETERDQLKRHYDAAAPEHDLLALLDRYQNEFFALQRLAAEGCEACGDYGELVGKCDELRKQVHRLKGDVHAAGIEGELAGAKREREFVLEWLAASRALCFVAHEGSGPVALAFEKAYDEIKAGEHRKGLDVSDRRACG